MALTARTSTSPIRVDFDAQSDVLYISLGQPVPSDSDSQERGIQYRFAWSDNAPSGVTIMGFKFYGWNNRLSELAEIVGDHIKLSPRIVEPEIVKAVK